MGFIIENSTTEECLGVRQGSIMQPSITLDKNANRITMIAGGKKLILDDGGISCCPVESEMHKLAMNIIQYGIITPIVVGIYMVLIAIGLGGYKAENNKDQVGMFD